MSIIRFHTELNVYRKSFDVAMQMYRLSIIHSPTHPLTNKKLPAIQLQPLNLIIRWKSIVLFNRRGMKESSACKFFQFCNVF